MLGYSYQALGQHDDALEIYDMLAAVTTDNPNPIITANRGLAFAETGDYESGVALLRSVIDSHPDPVLVQSTIGDIYAAVAEGQSEAERAYNEALTLGPNDPRPHVGLGLLQTQANQFNGALEAFGTALANDPSYVPAYYQRASLRVDINLLDEALQDVDLAITFAPRVGELYALRGQILVRQGEWELASRALEQAMRNGVSSPQMTVDLATAYFELGNLDGAIRMSNEALAENTDNPAAWYQRGRAYLAQNELGSAVNDFDQGLQLAPENVDLLVGRCTAHARLGDDGSASIDCDAALALDNDNGYALEQRGLIRARAGDRTGAAEDFAEAISYAPDAYEAHYYLGLYALQENRYPQALESLSTSIELAPFLGKAHAARGVAYRITGEWERAIDDLETALELVPEDVYSYYELGLSKRGLADATFDSGEASAAQALYEEAADALLEFLNASQPGDPFVSEAQAALDYVNSALTVVQDGAN
jgi:tetratricopeptide (TPR) repeat protein